jgi:hypothetical protein
VRVGGWSGGGVQRDGVAEGFELADVVALRAFRVDAGVVEVGAEIVEAGIGVGQQMPDDGQDGAADGDDRCLLPAAGDAPVAFPEEGVGPAGDGGLAERLGEVGVAVPGGAAALRRARGFRDGRSERGPVGCQKSAWTCDLGRCAAAGPAA